MAMVRILGYSSNGVSETDGMPKEIVKSPSPSGDSGWLIRFFDSSFFCEWIAVSYLYKHEHSGVRDYLCNRMYSLPLSGIEGYLFQLSYMLLTKPSPSLDKYIVDMCSKSLRIAIKVHWFLLAEAEDSDDCEEIIRLQERCQRAAVTGTWPPLVRPNTASPKSRMFKILSSRRILPLASSIPIQKSNSQGSSAIITDDVTGEVVRSKVPAEDSDSSLKVLKRLMPGPKVRDAFFKKFRDKEDEETDQSKEAEQESFFRRIFREKDDDEKAVRNEDLTSIESFFRRIFRERTDASDDEEKESFFRKLFRDKHDDREKVDDEDKVIEEEEGPEFFLFRKFYKVHPEEDDKNVATLTENTAVGTPENSPGTEGFFKRLFRDRPLEDGKLNGRKEDRSSPSSFLKRLFKERIEEAGLAEDLASMSVHGEEHEAEFVDNHLLPKSTNPRAKNGFPDVSSEFIASQTLDFSVCQQNADDMHSTKIVFEDVVENANCKDTATSGKTSSNLAVHKIFNASEWSLTSSKPSNKRPGSPKQKTEMASSKPPLPKYSSFQIRKGTYHATLDFVKSLCDIASGLVDVFPLEHRRKALYESLAELNGHLAESDKGVCFPMGKGLYRIIHIPEDEAVLMNSREKAPFLVCFEVLKCDDQIPTKDQKDFIINKVSQGGIPLANSDAQLQRPPPWAYPPDSGHFLRSASRAIDQAMAHHWETKMKVVDVNFSICARPLESSSMQGQEFSDGASLVGSNGCTVLGKVKDCQELRTDGDQCRLNGPEQGEAIHQNSGEHGDWVTVKLRAIPGMNMEDVEDDVPMKRRDHRRVPSTIAMAQVREAAAKGEAPPGLPVKKGHPGTQDHIGFDVKATDALAGELWEHKRERIRKLSSFGAMPGWDLCSVIVKSGDDCRQEHLAVQLVSHFYDIFQEAGLPLWLRPYEVIVTSSHAALIETIPDTASIHAIKSRNSRLSSLREFFCNKYDENSPAFKLAQRNFVESMAGYSILCYILQVKDRHNANLLIDEDGHIIHIDFGFMLSNSPGGVNFESAPFKLTRELLEVMDSDAEGTASEFFDYFKVLCIQGFLTCRKHAERIILLVEMMQESGCPCFKGGPRAIQNLRKRFHLGLTEEQCVSLVLSLISSSLDAWRTRQYDYYQRVLNGIL